MSSVVYTPCCVADFVHHQKKARHELKRGGNNFLRFTSSKTSIERMKGKNKLQKKIMTIVWPLFMNECLNATDFAEIQQMIDLFTSQLWQRCLQMINTRLANISKWILISRSTCQWTRKKCGKRDKDIKTGGKKASEWRNK